MDRTVVHGAAETYGALRLSAGESLLEERTLSLPVPGRIRSYLEIIRFAAYNRLCVDLDYHGSVRRLEPYSLRRTRDDKIVLHATRASDGEHRSYRIDRIQGARPTPQSFIPRFAVELNPQAGPTRHSADREPGGILRSTA